MLTFTPTTAYLEMVVTIAMKRLRQMVLEISRFSDTTTTTAHFSKTMRSFAPLLLTLYQGKH